MAVDFTTFFTDIGTIVRMDNDIEDSIITNIILAEMTTIQNNFNDTEEEQGISQDLLSYLWDWKDDLEGRQDEFVTKGEDIVDVILKSLLASGETATADILDEAIDVFQDESQSVKGNNIDTWTETGDADSELDDWALTGVTRPFTTDGYLWATLTNPANHLLQIYADASGSYTVAIASIASTTATMTIAAVNASGITGTVFLTYTDGETLLSLRVFCIEDVDNSGTGNCGAITTTQMAKTETFTFNCTAAKTSSTGSRWEVLGSETGGNAQLTAGTAYTSDKEEFTLTITDPDTATYIKYGDPGPQVFNISLTGQTIGNTERTNYTTQDIYATMGLLYCDIKSIGSTSYTVAIYKDVGRASADLVALGTIQSISGTMTLTQQNTSGLSGTVEIDYTADDVDITLVGHIPFAVGDKLQYTITSDDQGVFQSWFRDRMEKVWNYVLTGAETINDNLAS